MHAGIQYSPADVYLFVPYFSAMFYNADHPSHCKRQLSTKIVPTPCKRPRLHSRSHDNEFHQRNDYTMDFDCYKRFGLSLPGERDRFEHDQRYGVEKTGLMVSCDRETRIVSYHEPESSRKRPATRCINISDKQRSPQSQVRWTDENDSFPERKRIKHDNDNYLKSGWTGRNAGNETRRLPKGGRSKSSRPPRQSNDMEWKKSWDPEMWDIDDMKHTACKDIRLFDNQTVSLIREFLRCHRACSEISRLEIFLKILSNMISSMTDEKIGSICNAQAKDLVSDLKVFSSECIPFWGGLAMTIKSLPYVQVKNNASVFVSRILDLMNTIMISDEEISKMAIPFLPLDDFFGALRQLNNGSINCYYKFSEKVDDLMSKRDEFRDSLKKVEICHKLNIGETDQMSFLNQLLNFINLSVQPTLSDLQPNKVKGCFSSKMEYLQIHFDLLKKDFLFPLQSALYHVQQNISDSGLNEDYYVYSNVTLVGRDILNYSLVYKIKFHFTQPQSTANYWEHSKRFTFGSLICFSEDKFQSIVFGVVAERTIEDLKKGIVGIRLVEHPESLILQEHVKYQMIQSPVYLEAYSPVLARLEQLRKHPGDLAFEKYLVDCNAEVSSPAYLQNIRLALDETELDEVGSFRDQFQLDSLDQSQMSALRLAFDNEVALIQGPPGTGKTFIGMKLVELLLKNRKLWRTANSSSHRPIAVFCYTNHALDQFLESIFERMKDSGVRFDMVRIGGRSKSETLKDYNLNKKLQNMRRVQKSRKKKRRYLLN